MLILSQILSSERLLNIRNDISYVFDSNRNPHQAISDAQLPTARGGQISVRSSCRMQDTRKHVAETGRSHAELQRVHEAKRRFPAVVFQFDRNQATHIRRAPTSRAISAPASISQTLSSGLEIVSAIRTRGLISRAFERNSSRLAKSTVTVLIPNEPKIVCSRLVVAP